MKKKESLSFAISFEELLVLLYHFKRNELAGLDQSPLNDMSDKEKNLLMAVAERALIARGFLTKGTDNKVKMIDPVLALVGTCLEPEVSLVVENTPTNNVEQLFFFHTARKMRVMHTTPVTGIHQFIAVEDDKAFLKALISTISLGDIQQLNCKDSTLDIAVLITVRDEALEKGAEVASKTLLENNMSEDTAKKFAQSLSNPVSNTTVSFIRNLDDTAEGFTFLKGQKSLWIITPNDDDDLVTIKNISSNDAIQKLKSLVNGTHS